MNDAIILPVIIPFAAAVLTLLGTSDPKRSHRLVLGGAILHICICATLLEAVFDRGILVSHVGNWPAPFGICLVADPLSAIMVMITAIINLAVTLYSRADISDLLAKRGYYPLLQVLVGGICGAFLTGDLFNLYVWFEVMLMASFGLLVLGREKAQLEGGIKYVVINLLSTLLFLTGIGLLYGMTGTLNMADLHLKVQAIENQGLLKAVGMVFMMAFGIKSALFPLFFWLPASYHTPPVSVSAIFSGLLTKVGVYAFIRVFTLIFIPTGEYHMTILLIISAFTMISGVLGAAAHNEFRRILSFHVISQVGYMIMGLALSTRMALAGAVFYLIHHIIVKTTLFLVSGVIHRLCGSFALKDIGGAYRHHGVVALLFFIPAFSLAGFPPLSGFWAKLILIKASIDIDNVAMATVAAVVGFLTIYSMTKIWAEVFWKPAPENNATPVAAGSTAPSPWMMGPIVGLVLLTLVIGLGAELFVKVALHAADTLIQPEVYVSAVLGTE